MNRAIAVTIGKKKGKIFLLAILKDGLHHVSMKITRKKKMSKLYKCPTWDYHCPYFCHQDKEGEGDYGLCLMQEMEGCSPVNECEAFYGIDEDKEEK